MIVDENMTREEYRQEMLEDQKHEDMLHRDVEYCIENFMRKEVVKAINEIEDALKWIRRYHEDISYEELREMI